MLSFPGFGNELTRMKILFIISIIETLAFFTGRFFAKTSEMRGMCGEYAVWSMVMTIAIGYIAFS